MMRDLLSMERAQQEELNRALRLLRHGDEPARVIDDFSRRLMNKLIHAPTKALRDSNDEEQALARLLAAVSSAQQI
jgi:glutamyl-tRNA reductase